MDSENPYPGETTRCVVCGAVVNRSRLEGLCPGCTWQSLSQLGEERTVGLPEAGPGAALFSVSNHVVLEEIARGGMGIVYRARQLEPARVVALKMLLPHQTGSAQMAERFRLEVRALTQLEHPAILPVYQMGQYEGMPFFTMKLATGGTLASRADVFDGKFAEIGRLMVKLAEAVQFAHERGVLHRDLKPGNILFDEDDRPYVSDFGLAKLADRSTGDEVTSLTSSKGEDEQAVPTSPARSASLTGSAIMLGTPEFLSPEVLNGGAAAATTAADVYGLGAVLYQLLTGRPPFAGEHLPALLRQISEQPPARPGNLKPGVPRDLEVICLKCLAKQPASRYRSARELAEDLGRWLEHRPILARPVPPWERARQWARNNPALTALSLLLAASLLIGGALLARANQRLRIALSQTQAAYAAARQNLHSALLAQSRALLESGDSAQRERLLTVLKQTAAIQPSAEARNQAVAALAWPEPERALSSPQTSPSAGDTNNVPELAGHQEAAADWKVRAPVFLRFPAPDDYHACTLDISRDGRFLLTGTMQSVALWDTVARTQIWSRAQLGLPWMYVAFPPDGKSLLYSARNLGIQRCEFHNRVTDEVTSLSHSPRETGAVIASPRALQVGNPLPVGRTLDTTIVGFTGREADWLVAAERTGLYISRIEIWPQGRPDLARPVAAGQAMTFFALSPDQAWGASTTVPGTDVRLWDARQATSIGFLGQTNAIIAEFSPDGRWLIARLPDHYGVWEAGSWRLTKQWPVTFGGWMGSRIVFSRNGRWVAAPWGGNCFELLDARDFSELCLLKAPLGFEAIAAVWNRDDTKLYLLDGGHRLYEWDITALRKELRAMGLDWAD